MPDHRLVTIATFHEPVAAAMAQNFLENEGIPSALLDEATIATDWMLASAIGGIKLQVAPEHVERAEFLLARVQEDPDDDDDDELPPAAATAIATREIAEELQAEREERDPINQLADRLLRTAIFGLILWPLQLYALLLLLELGGSEGRVSPERRWKVWVSMVLNVPLMALIVVPLFCLFNWFSGRH
jgi:hypothetical protein